MACALCCIAEQADVLRKLDSAKVDRVFILQNQLLTALLKSMVPPARAVSAELAVYVNRMFVCNFSSGITIEAPSLTPEQCTEHVVRHMVAITSRLLAMLHDELAKEKPRTATVTSLWRSLRE